MTYCLKYPVESLAPLLTSMFLDFLKWMNLLITSVEAILMVHLYFPSHNYGCICLFLKTEVCTTQLWYVYISPLWCVLLVCTTQVYLSSASVFFFYLEQYETSIYLLVIGVDTSCPICRNMYQFLCYHA
jgi:hypothetical protein